MESHTRNSGVELQHSLGSMFSVSSSVNPGAERRIIVDAVKEDIGTLKSDDVIVVWGGWNIGENNSKEGLRQVYNFFKNDQTVDITVMTAPRRHDLLSSSCVNNEMISFNRQKRMIIYKNVKILEIYVEREHFTKHGLHLNSSGKECIALKPATVVRSFFFNKERMSPICLQWKDYTNIFNQDRTNNDFYMTNCNEVTVLQAQPSNSPKVTNENKEKITDPEIAKRQRRKPALLNCDILWIT